MGPTSSNAQSSHWQWDRFEVVRQPTNGGTAQEALIEVRWDEDNGVASLSHDQVTGKVTKINSLQWTDELTFALQAPLRAPQDELERVYFDQVQLAEGIIFNNLDSNDDIRDTSAIRGIQTSYRHWLSDKEFEALNGTSTATEKAAKFWEFAS